LRVNKASQATFWWLNCEKCDIGKDLCSQKVWKQLNVVAGPGIMLEVWPGNFISIWEEKKFLNISHFSKTHATDQI
jgi:hypothetical protein